MIYRFYRSPALSWMRRDGLVDDLRRNVSRDIASAQTEWGYYVESSRELKTQEIPLLQSLLRETYEPENFGTHSRHEGKRCIEVGPRLAIVSPFSTNAVSICRACGLDSITRIERTRRFVFTTVQGETISIDIEKRIMPVLYDRMTEEPFSSDLTSLELDISPEPLRYIDVLQRGLPAVREANIGLGLGLTDYLIEYLFHHFDGLRNPTDAECFMFGQLNSNHCRHHDWNGLFIIDGVEMPYSLMDMIRQTVSAHPAGIEVAFKDNAAAIARHRIAMFKPVYPGMPSEFHVDVGEWCLTVKVETHNHPTGTEPYQGAATGIGGLLRDLFGTGRGGQRLTAVACYYAGNPRIPDYIQPWETVIGEPPRKIAKPPDILIQASNGASDYGNCEGFPVTLGSARTFEQLVDGEWIGYVKPIMVAGGIGLIDAEHLEKQEPEADLLVVQYGGDAYCIGIGGAGRSSVNAGSEEAEELDFASVQRGNPEMGQRTDRVTRACSELGYENPVVTIGDLGAGGDAVAPAEVTNPVGAKIYLRKLPSGDPTMSILQLVCNEAQERMIVLVRRERFDVFRQICERERCPMAVIGECTGDGKITFVDDDGSTPIDLDLDFLLSDLPRKRIVTERIKRTLPELQLPSDLTVKTALERIMRLPAVASKQWLTRKVDRSVGGLVAQQQCVGSLHLPLSDYAVTADSYFSLTGTVKALGEQPIKGIIDPAAGSRMSVAEALTNLMFAKVNGLGSVKFSATWQWPGGQPGEDARLYDAVQAATELCMKLGLTIPVGKDSMSMSAKGELDGRKVDIKAPGTVQFLGVAPMDDIRRKVTPDLKAPGESELLFINLAPKHQRLGGSALAQVYGQVGSEAPDVDDPKLLRAVFNAVQELVEKNLILSGHDRSDGGLITTLLEMAFGGNCGIDVNIFPMYTDDSPDESDEISSLFNEELGLVVEYLPDAFERIREVLEAHGLNDVCCRIGKTTVERAITISAYRDSVFWGNVDSLRKLWQETSYEFDRRQALPYLVDKEQFADLNRQGAWYRLAFVPEATDPSLVERKTKPRVAILREAGTNGDREMAAAFYAAGFEVHDVTMTDLVEGRVTLERFRGVVFCGGFSYADTLDAGKGWAGVISYNPRVREQFERFYAHRDTFSLGVCNGCQVMALLGWVPWAGIETERQPRFLRNPSEIFESRFSTVRILPSPSILFKGMHDSLLGIWVDHGEGRFHCPDADLLQRIEWDHLAPLRFVNEFGAPTEEYPRNPNGSSGGITALCTPDGRHLAMMPHAERLFQPWQWPYWPRQWEGLTASPWLRMFQNAREWCEEHK